MNEFNKKYLQIVRKYNYKPNEIINENFITDAWDWTKEKVSDIGNFFGKMIKIIKGGPNTLLKVVKGWFDNANDPQSGKNSANLVSNLLNIENKLPIKEGMFDWFSKLCNQVKGGIKLIKSDAEIKKFHDYLKNNKNLSDQQIKNISYLDCKNYLNEFVKKEIPEEKVITENKELITEAAAIGFLVVLLIVLLVAYYILTQLRKEYCPNSTDTTEKAIEDMKNKEELEKKRQEHQQTMENLSLEQLKNLLKGCDALK